MDQPILSDKFEVTTVHSFENSTSYLIIKNVTDVDLRSYECEVKRDDITKSQKIRLYGYGKYLFMANNLFARPLP